MQSDRENVTLKLKSKKLRHIKIFFILRFYYIINYNLELSYNFFMRQLAM